MVRTATILARNNFGDSQAKTVHGLIRHGKRFKIRSVIDETLAGRDAGEVMGLGVIGIPIVKKVDIKADILIIGVATSGGKLSTGWREDIITAIKNGMDVISGMHEFLSEDPELVVLANEYGVKLLDMRVPPQELHIAQHKPPTVPVILVCGTDDACGKNTTLVELYNEALSRGINAGFIATGVTGLMIGCDAGVVVDQVPTDFVAGAVEQLVQDLIQLGKGFIFVESQGSVLHHAYSTSAIGILHGAQPKFIVLVHPTYRKHRSSFPEIPLPNPEEEISALEQLSPGSKVIALSLNCHGAKNYREICKDYEKRLGLIATDVLLDPSGTDRIMKKILSELLGREI
jgi:uncharacterized NAD-dependent epimerase/dehydratase family protein